MVPHFIPLSSTPAVSLQSQLTWDLPTMKHCFGLLLLIAAPAVAQPSPVMDAVRLQYGNAKRNLIESAQVMPEQHYSFRLTPPQRPFGEWIEHTAALNLRVCATAQGVQPPAAPRTSGSKDEIVKAIEASFAFCDAALASMSDEQALRVLNPNPRRTALDSLLGLVASLNSHYGNIVGYLRVKGITPPSTARAQPHKH
ncbi:MAG TPA: hypothetical protein DCY80_16390 [Solibacterales bacterium]|nr:hypothetical protein [Bryobacterales bacterium]